jgi:divinyl protochlorophyllide a 8-vinyl-reductase
VTNRSKVGTEPNTQAPSESHPASGAATATLPAGTVAGVLLLTSIGKHTWAFAGSARVSIKSNPRCIAIAGCPICRGTQGEPALCDYYVASFETLFRKLVSRRAVVRELTCEALGAAKCTFEICC